jgi:branched-subunit amino acid ABC-type transport system permease component
LFGQLFAGLSLGSVLLLAALGLSLTFGQMGVINMAHGEFMMAGAYTVFVVQGFVADAGLALIVSIPLGFLLGVVGTYLGKDKSAANRYNELSVRALTGAGAEGPGKH